MRGGVGCMRGAQCEGREQPRPNGDLMGEIRVLAFCMRVHMLGLWVGVVDGIRPLQMQDRSLLEGIQLEGVAQQWRRQQIGEV